MLRLYAFSSLQSTAQHMLSANSVAASTERHFYVHMPLLDSASSSHSVQCHTWRCNHKSTTHYANAYRNTVLPACSDIGTDVSRLYKTTSLNLHQMIKLISYSRNSQTQPKTILLLPFMILQCSNQYMNKPTREQSTNKANQGLAKPFQP